MSLSDDERLHYEQALVELRSLQRSAHELARSLNLDDVLARCLDLVIEAAQAQAGVIYLDDPERDQFRRVEVRHLPDEIAPPSFPRQFILTASNGRLLWHIDVAPDSPNPMVVAAHQAGYRNVVVLTLRSEDKLMGFLAAHFREGRPSDSTVRTMEAIARQGALAIGNAGIHQTVERRGRMANGLREFSERALSCDDPCALYRLILDSAMALTGSDRGLIAEVQDQSARCVKAAGADHDMVDLVLPITTPYLAEILAKHEPELCENTAALDPRSILGGIAHRKGTRSYIACSMWHADHPIGLIFVASGVPRRYEPDEREALQILASLAGEAVERVAMVERLAAEKQRLDAVLEHLPTAVAVIGPVGELLHINAAARAFALDFGAHGSWRESLNQFQVLDREGKPIPREEFLITRAFHGETLPPRELTLVGSNGTRKHFLLMASPLFEPDGKVEAVVAGLQDVTSLRQLADAKDHFLRIASHELRSPLTALRATTSLLEIDPSAIQDADRRTVLLSRVQRQVARLTHLVEQLIDSVRLNATEPPLERCKTDLVALCGEVIDTFPDGKRVVLEASGPVEGVWDALRLEQVVSNLLSNAARYSPAGAPILVKLHSDDKSAVLEVADRGIGIPAEQIECLFTPFFRASNAALQSRGGLGLGLHIAHEIVRRHGGSLTVKSQLGQGTQFTVVLPVDTGTPSG